MTTPPKSWRRSTLGEVARYINGMAFKPSDWTRTGRPIVRIQNLTDREKPCNRFDGAVDNRYLIEDGDLLISWSASLGAFIWDRGSAVLNQHIFRVEEHQDLITREFLYFLVLHMLEDMKKHTHGSTMKHITKSKFENLEILLPPLGEQQRIVARIKELLERVDEVRTLRDEALKEASALESAVFADFVTEYQNTDPSTTPVALGDVLVRAQYGTSQKANTNDDGVPVLRMGNIQDGHLDVSDLKHIRLPEKELKKYLLKEGDILFNRTNSLELVGKAATFTGLQDEWVFASYLVRLEVDRSRAIPEYVTGVINSRIGRDFVRYTARRAIGMVNINAKQIQQLEMPLPPISDQEALVERLKEARKATASLKDDLALGPVEALPEAILRNAFAGEF